MDKYIFAQLTSFIDRNHFNYLVKELPKKSLCETFHLLEPTPCNDVW
ncbi:MAG: DUF4372 domain-containing protein [Phocaeicola sp.]